MKVSHWYISNSGMEFVIVQTIDDHVSRVSAAKFVLINDNIVIKEIQHSITKNVETRLPE